MAVKGKTNNPNGRPQGTPNKSTSQAREAIAKFVDGNVGRFNGWLEQIAADDPAKAMDLMIKVMEYHLPKLNRTDVQQLDKNGNPADLPSKIVVEHVRAKE